MPAGYTTIVIEVGSTFTMSLVLTDSAGSVIDLTDYDSAACKIRKSYYSDLYTHPLTVTFEDPRTDGKVIVSATAAETATFKPGRYVFTLEITDDVVVERILEGIAEVRPDAVQ